MSITKFMNGECLIEAMDSVRELCSVGNSIRAKNKIRNRCPLPKMEICDHDGKWTWLACAKDMVDIIKDEVNVKEIVIYYDGMKVTL